MINPMDLTGKHILITGASSGIGQATSILASNLGADVSLIARDEPRLNKTLAKMKPGKHRIYPCDLTQLDQIEGLVKQITGEQGFVDGLAHCAGITADRPVLVSKPDFLNSVMKINFYSFAELIRTLSKKRHLNDNASIVGISSTAGICGDKAQGAYAASKAAMNGFIHPIAKEFSNRKIRVNSVAFGMVRTGMFDIYKTDGGDVEKLNIRQYLGIGEPEDAANVICFLLSNAARFITGTTLIADGGNLS